jgi:hypothetical protein
VVGNSVAGPPIGYPPRRHYGSPAVALELRSNVEVDFQRVPGRYILHRIGPCTKVDKRKALIGSLSWHRMLCEDDAHTMSIRMVWVKCTTSAECKSIRISRVLGHGRLERSLHYPMQFWFFLKWFSEKWRKVPDGVLRGYCRGTGKVRSTWRVLPGKLEKVMCD